MKTRTPFTLIEIIVSLGILSLILLVSSLTVSTVYQTWSSISEHDEELRQYRNIDRVVETAFRNAVPFRWRDRNNKEVTLFTGGTNVVFLTYLHRIDEREQGGIRFLRLFLEEGRLIAEYRQHPFLNDDRNNNDILEREVIADGVTGLTFIYADRVEQHLEWFDEWDVELKKNLPVGIQMEVRFQNGKRQIWLRRTAGNGQFHEWGRRLIPQR